MPKSALSARTIAFADIDTDNSGEVTIDELRAYMQREDPSITEVQVQRWFDAMNADGNGCLKIDEFEKRHTLDKQPPPVELHPWYAEMVVKKLQSTSWEEVRMVITPDVIALGPVAGGGYDEVIPLCEVDRLLESRDPGRVEGGWSPLRSVLIIFTVNFQDAERLYPLNPSSGYNLGRKYCISADFPLQIQEGGTGERIEGTAKHVEEGQICSIGDFVELMRVLESKAKNRHQSQTSSAKFARSRLAVRALFEYTPFQLVIGAMLIVNFALEVCKNQLQDILVDHDGRDTQIAATFAIADNFFLVVFTIELFLNIYARWMREFLNDGWCCFDALVIAMALISPFIGDSPIPVTIFRLFRALRILRLFGRLKSVRSIINALSASLLPVANAFFIMFVVLMIYAIVGVGLLEESAPTSFAKFDRAVCALLRIAAGETWVDGMDVIDAESGAVNWLIGGYIFSFILLVNWTLLQVSVAVLLDNFVSGRALALAV
jgi:hypothetical protein